MESAAAQMQNSQIERKDGLCQVLMLIGMINNDKWEKDYLIDALDALQDQFPASYGIAIPYLMGSFRATSHLEIAEGMTRDSKVNVLTFFLNWLAQSASE